MAYSTKINVKQEAGFSSNSNISTQTVDRHISAADSIIDSKIGKRYTLPLTETPSIIEHISRLLSAGALMKEEYGTQAEGTSKDGQDKINQADMLLDMIMAGEIVLIGADGTELTNSESISLDGFPGDTAGTDRTTQSTKDDPPIIEIGQTF